MEVNRGKEGNMNILQKVFELKEKYPGIEVRNDNGKGHITIAYMDNRFHLCSLSDKNCEKIERNLGNFLAAKEMFEKHDPACEKIKLLFSVGKLRCDKMHNIWSYLIEMVLIDSIRKE